MNKEHIAFVIHSGIGNTLHIIPAIKAIRSIKPDAQIDILCWPRSYKVIEGLKEADNIIQTDPTAYLMSLKRKIDYLLVSPVGAIVTPQMETLSDQVMRIKIPNGLWCQHEVEYNMQFAYNLGYEGEVPQGYVPINDSNISKVKEMLRIHDINKFIAINAAFLKEDHWHLKHWGTEKFAYLLFKLQQKFPDYTIVFVGSKADQDEYEKIMAATLVFTFDPTKVFSFCGWSDDIKDTAALLSVAEVCVGNDGGLQHIAANVQTPTVTIFTFTNTIKNRPYANNAKIVALDCDRRLTCQHSGNYAECVCLDVPVSAVYATVKGVLDDKSGAVT